MLCEKYKNALIDAAITGAELPPAIRAHAESCAACAGELAQHRSLTLAIDENLHREMNAPVPAALLHRFEAKLAQQPQPERSPRFAQIFAGGLATLAVAATIVLMLPRQTSKIHSAKPADAQPAQKFQVDHMQLVNVPPPFREPATKPAQRDLSKPATPHLVHSSLASTETSSHTEPEVLVPPDERVALDQLIANLGARHELVAAFVKPLPEKPEQPVKHIEIPDIKTAAVFIAPIAEETRR